MFLARTITVTGTIFCMFFSTTAAADNFDKLKKTIENEIVVAMESETTGDGTSSASFVLPALSDRNGPLCIDEICVGDNALSPKLIGLSTRLPRHLSKDLRWLDSDGNEVQILPLKAKYDQELAGRLASVTVACTHGQIELTGFPLTITLEPKQNIADGWQGFHVVEIRKNYRIQARQYLDWRDLVISRFPEALEANGAIRGRVTYSKGVASESTRIGTYKLIASGEPFDPVSKLPYDQQPRGSGRLNYMHTVLSRHNSCVQESPELVL